MSEKRLIIITALVAIVLIGGAYVYRIGFYNLGSSDLEQSRFIETKGELILGKLRSDHAHISFLLLIDNELVNFTQQKYMLKAEDVHFENDNGIVIHKHATGLAIPYFLSTLGIQLDQSCLELDTGQKYCNNGSKTLRLIVNGKEVKNFDDYELRQADRILLNYGDDTDTDLQLKFNNVPYVPEEHLE